LCQENPEFRLELTAQGELIIMPPTGSKSGWRSGRSYYALTNWADEDGSGLTFDSSAGFTLPNGQNVHQTRPGSERTMECPDSKTTGRFASLSRLRIEVRSLSDRLTDLQAKMQEYIANGARLGG
jgi:Uma2 family endonuclease